MIATEISDVTAAADFILSNSGDKQHVCSRMAALAPDDHKHVTRH
jgi:hypothetical protein